MSTVDGTCGSGRDARNRLVHICFFIIPSLINFSFVLVTENDNNVFVLLASHDLEVGSQDIVKDEPVRSLTKIEGKASGPKAQAMKRSNTDQMSPKPQFQKRFGVVSDGNGGAKLVPR